MGSAPPTLDSTHSSATIHAETAIQCRKCGFEHSTPVPSCHRCGLSFSFAATLSTDHQFDGLPPDGLGEVLRSQWKKVSQDPHDTSGHEKFIARCQSVGHLPFAGHCYQKAYDAAERDEDRRIFETYRKQVIAQAGFLLPVKQSRSSSGNNYKWVTYTIGALILFGLSLLFFWGSKGASHFY